jgi:hypothetical protein
MQRFPYSPPLRSERCTGFQPKRNHSGNGTHGIAAQKPAAGILAA